MKEKYFKNEAVEMWIENGIIYSNHPVKTHLTLGQAQDNVKQRLLLAGNVVYPILFDVRNVISVEKSAREFLSSPGAVQGLSAGALLIGSELERMLSNFFMRINKPPRPIKAFTNVKSAEEWLYQFRKPD